MIKEKLMRIQVELKAPKNLYNNFGGYKYRNAEGICEAVKPYLDKEKVCLFMTDDIIEVGGRIYVKATAKLLDNETDEVVEVSAMAREAETKKGMDESQITGTASSYARKYALNGLFLLDDTKDADTDEYHKQTTGKKTESVELPTSEADAKDKCSDKQVKFIESLIVKKAMSQEEILSKYKGVKSFADLSKAQAKALIDYLTRE